MSLHPDKIAALDLLANGASPTNREPLPSSTVENRAVNAAKTRKMDAMPKEPGVLDELAYNMHGARVANHLKRLKAAVRGREQTKQPAQAQPQIVLQLPGMTNGGN